jgi:hypothetical protein
MAITTLDGAIAGMQYPRTFAKAVTGTMVAGRPHSLFYLAGAPGAAVANTAGLSGAALTTYAGQIPFTNPVLGNTYLARFQGQATIAGTLVLADRLWHNSGLVVTTTTAQTITSAAFPARDVAGTINGDGVRIGLEVSTATGAGAATPTISYTNQAAAAGKAGAMEVAYAASSIAGTFYPFTLAAGDTGVKSVESCTLGVSMTSGTIHLVAYRELARLELTSANIPNAIDALTSGFPRLFNDTVPFIFFIPSTTTTSNISGSVVYTQG